jgi:hypothetical protein
LIDDTSPAALQRAPVRDTGALLLAAGGLAAAFGAASCCALPLLLGSLGLGSAWLVTVAWFAAPHRLALLAVSISVLPAPVACCSGVVDAWRLVHRVPRAEAR